MLTHIRRDDAIRPLPLLLLTVCAPVWICALVLVDLFADLLPVRSFWVARWIPLALYLLAAQARRRASVLDLGLPFPARRLWLAHNLALGLGGTTILALAIGLGALFFYDALHALSCSRAAIALVIAAAVVTMLFGPVVERGWIVWNDSSDIAEALLRQLAGALPGGQAVLVVLAVLLLGAAYALAEARFRRFEVPPIRVGAEPMEI